MLPGFRFVFAATILTMSLVIFGLGAAALLRATHDEFVSIPSRRPPPDMLTTRQPAPLPTLAMVREMPEPVAAPSAARENEVARDAEPSVEPPAQVAAVAPIAIAPEVAPEAVGSNEPQPLPIPETQTYALPPVAAIAAIPDTLTPADQRAEKIATASVTTLSIQRETSAAIADNSEPSPDARIATLGGPAVDIAAPAAAKKPVAAKPKTTRRKVARRTTKPTPRAAQQQQPFSQSFAQPAFSQSNAFGGFPR